MNFLLTVHVAPVGHPQEADPKEFRLIAPFNTDPTYSAANAQDVKRSDSLITAC
jgi:hypothetical protein